MGPMTEDDERVHPSQAHSLATTMLRDAAQMPTEELEKAYREVKLSSLLAELVRQQVGVGISEKHFDIYSFVENGEPPDSLTQTIQANQDDLKALMTEGKSERKPDFNRETVEAILVAARYVADRAKNKLLTTTESATLATAMGMAFSRALMSFVENDHPGDVQGHA